MFVLWCVQADASGLVDPRHRWNVIQTLKGSYGPEDCINDIAEIKFDIPIPIKVMIHLH